MNGVQSVIEAPVEKKQESINCPDNSNRTSDVSLEQKRKEIKEKIDNSGLADTLRNIFKN
jgi:hypothetical protein